jgi:cysteine-rich repeat protein
MRHLAPGTYYVSVEEFSNDALVPGYLLFFSIEAVCGNGVVEGDEECDGGDLCTELCERVPVCGDGFIDGPEQCDDGNTANGDGCDAACQREQVCGNGFLEDPEACDDGNTAAGDGCSPTCTVEAGHVYEHEPDDSPGTATSIPAPAIAHGSINPAGEKDFYSFVVPNFADVTVETFDGAGPSTCANGLDTIVELLGTNGATVLATDDDDGPGSCSIIKAASDAGARHLAPGTYYVTVKEFHAATVVPAYTVRVSFSALCGNGTMEGSEECDGGPTCTATCERIPVCGDGFIDDPEQCDDGNVASGDGCSSTCQREQQCGNGTLEAPEVCDDGNTVSGDGCDAACATIEAGHAFEREPNNTPATASDGDPGLRIHGRINPVADKDYYRIKLSAPASLRIETFDNASPTTNTCTSIDTIIKLFAADGTTQIATDDDDGPGNCSKLDPATDAPLMNLAAGVYYLVVDEYNDDGLIPGYQVVITTL